MSLARAAFPLVPFCSVFTLCPVFYSQPSQPGPRRMPEAWARVALVSEYRSAPSTPRRRLGGYRCSRGPPAPSPSKETKRTLPQCVRDSVHETEKNPSFLHGERSNKRLQFKNVISFAIISVDFESRGHTAYGTVLMWPLLGAGLALMVTTDNTRGRKASWRPDSAVNSAG